MEDIQDIIKQAKDEFEAICKKYNVALVPVTVHRGDSTASTIEIVPQTPPPGQPSVE